MVDIKTGVAWVLMELFLFTDLQDIVLMVVIEEGDSLRVRYFA